MSSAPSQLRCPTCGARQEPAPECRRCKCDLSQLLAVLGQRARLHAATLQSLREGKTDQALAAARKLWSLSPDAQAARLLGVCYLLRGRFRSAVEVRDHDRHSSSEVART